MMSVVVKNPLRQGLHWAGDGRAATRNRGKVTLSAGEAVEGEQEERNGEEGNADALMSVLVRITVVVRTHSQSACAVHVHAYAHRSARMHTQVRRPLRGALALAEQLAPPDKQHSSQQSHLQPLQPPLQEASPASAAERAQADASVVCGSPGDVRTRPAGGGEEGLGRAQGEAGGGSLMSMVVKEPLRKSGWVEREEEDKADRNGVWGAKRAPGLVTIMVKQPLRQFVWGSSPEKGGKRLELDDRGSEEVGMADDCEDLDDVQGVMQSDSHWNFGLRGPLPPAGTRVPAADTSGVLQLVCCA